MKCRLLKTAIFGSGFLFISHAAVASECHVQAQVTPSNNAELILAEGTSNCLSQTGEVISETPVKLVVFDMDEPTHQKSDDKIFVSRNDGMDVDVIGEYVLTSAALGLVGRSDSGTVQVNSEKNSNINGATLAIFSSDDPAYNELIQEVAHRGRGYHGGRAIHRGGAVYRRGGVVYRGGYRGGYVAPRYCDPRYSYCGGSYGGGYYRGGGAVYRRGGAVYRSRGHIHRGPVHRGVHRGAVRRR